MDDAARRARKQVTESHAATVKDVLECADLVEESWEGSSTKNRDEVVPVLHECLRRNRTLERLPSLLVDAVDAAGFSLQASPVPKPPYVVITTVGPVLRATVSKGSDRRLVITLRVFRIAGNGNGIRRSGSSVEECVEVNVKE